MGRLGIRKAQIKKKNTNYFPSPPPPKYIYIHLTLSEKNSEMPFFFLSMIQTVWRTLQLRIVLYQLDKMAKLMASGNYATILRSD